MIGQTFEPGSDKNLRQSLNGQTGSLSPNAQQALRVLSLRLPSVLSGSPVAVADLLKPRVGGGAPTSGVGMPSQPGKPSGITQAPQGSGGSPELMALINLITNALGSSADPNFSVISDPNRNLNLDTAMSGNRNTGISGYGFPNGNPTPGLDQGPLDTTGFGEITPGMFRPGRVG